MPFIRSPGLSVKESDFSPAVISRRLGRGKTVSGVRRLAAYFQVQASPTHNG